MSRAVEHLTTRAGPASNLDHPRRVATHEFANDYLRSFSRRASGIGVAVNPGMNHFTTYMLALGLFSACALPNSQSPQSPDTNPRDPGDPQDPGNPPDPEPVSWTAELAGTYELENHFDLTAAAVLPETLYTSVNVLAGLRDDPAGTLFTLLEDANAPVLSDLLAVLPSALEDRLQGWINSYITSSIYQNTSVTTAMDTILVAAQTVLTQFDVVTELDVPDTETSEQALHRLRALRLHMDGHTFEIALEPIASIPLFVGEAPAAVSVTAHADGRTELALGTHAFGVPYGAYAYDALEYVVTRRYGADIRTTLGAMVNCPGMAAHVANQCVLGVCVGHEQALRDLCEQGLDLAVDELRTRMHAVRFDAMQFASGQAAMVKDPATSELSIRDGQWQAAIDIGMGLRSLPATFTGTRLP